MQTGASDPAARNALAIGRANDNWWGHANFRVELDGTMYAANGTIGAFTFDNTLLEALGDNNHAPALIRLKTVDNLYKSKYTELSIDGLYLVDTNNQFMSLYKDKLIFAGGTSNPHDGAWINYYNG
jgi:hypothetical protein